MNVYKSVSDLIGNTPILELTNIKTEYNLDANLYAKLEMFNPAGSAKVLPDPRQIRGHPYGHGYQTA